MSNESLSARDIADYLNCTNAQAERVIKSLDGSRENGVWQIPEKAFRNWDVSVRKGLPVRFDDGTSIVDRKV